MLLWLLHQKGLFDPLYDWWEDICGANEQEFIMDRHRVKINQAHHHIHDNKHRKQEVRHLNHRAPNRRKTSYEHNHKHTHSEENFDYFNHLHCVQKETHKHRHKNMWIFCKILMITILHITNTERNRTLLQD